MYYCDVWQDGMQIALNRHKTEAEAKAEADWWNKHRFDCTAFWGKEKSNENSQ